LAAGLGELLRGGSSRKAHGELRGKAEFRQSPNDPLGRIELPWLHAVAVIVLKLVVIVVVAFAKGEDSHEPGVTSAAVRGVGAIAKVVAERIDAERAVLEEDHTGHTGNEKGASAETQPPQI
jgi:hypothetical protein